MARIEAFVEASFRWNFIFFFRSLRNCEYRFILRTSLSNGAYRYSLTPCNEPPFSSGLRRFCWLSLFNSKSSRMAPILEARYIAFRQLSIHERCSNRTRRLFLEDAQNVEEKSFLIFLDCQDFLEDERMNRKGCEWFGKMSRITLWSSLKRHLKKVTNWTRRFWRLLAIGRQYSASNPY